MNSSVLAYLENSADCFPDKCAVTDEKVSYTYSELVKLSSSVGTALSELITSGDAVGIYMEKCADAVAAFFAAVKLTQIRSTSTLLRVQQALQRELLCVTEV